MGDHSGSFLKIIPARSFCWDESKSVLIGQPIRDESTSIQVNESARGDESKSTLHIGKNIWDDKSTSVWGDESMSTLCIAKTVWDDESTSIWGDESTSTLCIAKTVWDDESMSIWSNESASTLCIARTFPKSIREEKSMFTLCIMTFKFLTDSTKVTLDALITCYRHGSQKHQIVVLSCT